MTVEKVGNSSTQKEGKSWEKRKIWERLEKRGKEGKEGKASPRKLGGISMYEPYFRENLIFVKTTLGFRSWVPVLLFS